MNPLFILFVIIGYIGLLYVVSWLTSKRADANAFYLAGRKASWPMVSYGMIGVAISGITFISVPGEVANSGFTYFQLVIGYALGLMLVIRRDDSSCGFRAGQRQERLRQAIRQEWGERDRLGIGLRHSHRTPWPPRLRQ